MWNRYRNLRSITALIGLIPATKLSPPPSTTMPCQSKKRKATDGGDPPRTSRSRSKKRISSSPEPDPFIDPEDETDRTKIHGPIEKFVNAAMQDTWDISQHFQMCILFDSMSPVRVFKRGSIFNEHAEDAFPDYDPNAASDVTETDESGVSQPYRPVDYVYAQSESTYLCTNQCCD